MEKAEYTSGQIADWLLWYNKKLMETEPGDLMTNTRLEMIMYYAQGMSLGTYNRPLFDEDFVAGKYGVQLPSVHKKYRFNWYFGIDFVEAEPAGISEQDKELLIFVFDQYSRYSTRGLSLLNTHEHPWKSTTENEVVPKEKIRDFFRHSYLRMPIERNTQDSDEALMQALRDV